MRTTVIVNIVLTFDIILPCCVLAVIKNKGFKVSNYCDLTQDISKEENIAKANSVN